MWFATYDGLNKYDGYNFTVYRHQYKKANSIANDITRCIVVDDDNRIWIGTRDGLSLYNHRNDESSNFIIIGKDKMFIMNIVPIQRGLADARYSGRYFAFDIKRGHFLNDTLFTALHLLKPSTLVKQENSKFTLVQKEKYILILCVMVH